MRNCILTDLRRVFRKKSFIICMSIILLLMIIGLIVIFVHPFKDGVDSTYSIMMSLAMFFNPFLIGIPVFSAIYTDDFKSKSMQTALGFGISRNKMIMSRFLEALFMVVECIIFLSVMLLIFGLAGGVSMSEIGETVLEIWIDSFQTIGFLALALIIVYGTQKPTMGLVLFILLSAGVFATLIEALSLIPALKKHDIDPEKYLPTGVIVKISDLADKGDYLKAVGPAFLFLIFYVALPVWISMRLFRKKELEF